MGLGHRPSEWIKSEIKLQVLLLLLGTPCHPFKDLWRSLHPTLETTGSTYRQAFFSLWHLLTYIVKLKHDLDYLRNLGFFVVIAPWQQNNSAIIQRQNCFLSISFRPVFMPVSVLCDEVLSFLLMKPALMTNCSFIQNNRWANYNCKRSDGCTHTHCTPFILALDHLLGGQMPCSRVHLVFMGDGESAAHSVLCLQIA